MLDEGDIALKASNIINLNRILKLHGWLRGPDEAPSGITVGWRVPAI
jgi:hypothetical protein